MLKIGGRRFYATKGLTFTLKEPFLTHKIEQGPGLEVESNKEELLHMYRQMAVIRRMETAADEDSVICALGKKRWLAVPVGIEAALTKEDNLITAYRCHGFVYTRGGTVVSILSELMGRQDGIAAAKGGSMHMFTDNFFGGNGIVGAQVPLGAGIALAQKYREDKAVTFAMYGDGASNQGQVFEAFNMAKLWNLPVVFICENNRYGMGTSAKRSSASTDYYARGDYIPGIKVNGMDVLAVKQGSKFAREWCLSGKGPLVMEISTYRYGGHSMSDPGTTYRTREEIQHMRSTNDPLMGLKQILIDNNLSTEAELKGIDKEVKAEVEEAIEKSKSSPEPSPDNYWTDVYAKGHEVPYLRGRYPGEIHTYKS